MQPQNNPLRGSARNLMALTADDIVKCILQYLQRRPLLEMVGSFFDDLERNKSQPFKQCFSSKSRVTKLIQDSPNEQYVLVILKYSKADPAAIRPILESRIPMSYMYLKPEFAQMQATVDNNKRQQLAIRNMYKIQLIHENIIKRYQVDLPAFMLLNFITLIPGDLKANNHIVLFNEYVNRIVKLEKTFQLEYVFNLISLELSGSGSMAAVLSKMSIMAAVLADKLITYCQQKGRQLSKLLKILAKNYKTVKFYDTVCEIANKLNSKQQNDQIVELFKSFAKPVMLKDMARDIFYFEGERAVKSLLASSKPQFTGTLSAEEFNWLVNNINKNHICEHLLLLQTLAKRCLPTNQVDQFYNYLEKYLEPHQKSLGLTLNATSAKDLFATMNDFHPPSSNVTKPNLGLPKTAKDLFSPQSSKQINKIRAVNTLPKQQTVNVCNEFVGFPNLGNSCYINSFFVAIYFCKQFSDIFFHSTPKDVTLQHLRNLLIHLYYKQKKEVLSVLTSLKKTLPEEFSSNCIQQDTMEFGRLMIDKITSINDTFKKLFEIRIEQTILCPKGDIIEKREVTEFFMLLSFEDPMLFSKLQSKVGGELDLNSMIIRDYFTATVIEGDFECEVCKCKYNKREKRQRIVAMPNILIVVLSRFTYDLDRSAKRKICDKVRIDNWLLFGNITSQNKPDNYRLTSFINHMGKNADSGHYQSYVRYPKQENRWLNFDDDFVTETYQGKVVDLVRGMIQYDTPYVLFYERRS